MAPSATSSPPFEFNFKPLLRKSGSKSSLPQISLDSWLPNSIELFDFSPDSDLPTLTLSETEAPSPKLVLPNSPDCSLLDFIHDAWPILEPATVYQHTWHIEVLCTHLEAISRGELQACSSTSRRAS
jgi:hypothetical protein